MSAQDLMNGFAAYTDVEELAAQSATAHEEMSSTITISLITGVSISLTAEHTC
ncbi:MULTISPECIES: LxmA leader domain family RiPP [Streptomyces]|uniref:LxmA leader domain family RiPP n=1 Tax=Streptomyces TaxID=1883 RepID=UPI000A9219A0|nr:MULTISPECIES: LxmA leader domain family RiPP [Streptomyces]MCH0558113.1 LxmA leader domain family RiPP [Streptomyces sp. MUM 16J]